MVSRLADAFEGHLRVALYVLLATSSAMFLWVLLLDDRVLAFHKDELYVAVILGISAGWSTPALFLELASEIAFPVSEAIVGGYMIFLSNLVGVLFYLSYFLPWMSKDITRSVWRYFTPIVLFNWHWHISSFRIWLPACSKWWNIIIANYQLIIFSLFVISFFHFIIAIIFFFFLHLSTTLEVLRRD